MTGHGFRLATRLARREVRHRPGRTALVALLIALPVAAMFVADVAVRTNRDTPLELWQRQYGAADAIVQPGPSLPPSGPVRTLLDASRIVPGRVYFDNLLFRTTDLHRSSVDISALPMTNPLTRGIVQLTSGRAPRGGNEIFLTRNAARDLHVRAGNTLRLVRPSRHTFTVTGVGEFAAAWGQTSVVLPTGERYPWKTQPPAVMVASPAASTGVVVSEDPKLVDLPSNIRTSELQRWLRSSEASAWGLQVSPALIPPPPDLSSGAKKTESAVRWSWVIGAVVLTVAGIVIGAAFAAGARRQLVTLGQLAANGAPPQLLRQVLFLQGTWTGIVGAVLGFGISVGALAVSAPYADRIFRKDVHAYTVRSSDLIPIVLLGVVTATIAALLPARTTSRVPVLTALAGRRPLGKVPRWLPISGVCVATGGLGLLALAVIGARGNNGARGSGTVWALTAIVGGVAVLLGACAVAPAYVSALEPAASRTRGSARIAVRSLARQRTRTGAVVSAIAATAALAIAASALVLGADKKYVGDQTSYLRADEVQLSGSQMGIPPSAPPVSAVVELQKALPRARRFQVTNGIKAKTAWQILHVLPDRRNPLLSTPEGEIIAIAIANRALVDEYGLTARARQLLAERGALYLGPTDGRVVVAPLAVAPGTDAPVTPALPGTPTPSTPTVEAAMVGERYILGSLPRLLVTPAEARHLGLTAYAGMVVLRTPKPLTKDQRNLVRDLTYDAERAGGSVGPVPNANSVSIDFYIPSNRIDPLIIEWALVGIALVLVLFVVAVNLALSASETRDERDVLTIVGASPAAMRRASGYKAGLLTVMGSLPAIPVGFLPVAVYHHKSIVA